MSRLDADGNIAEARSAWEGRQPKISNRVDADGNLLRPKKRAKNRKWKIPDYKYGDDPTRMYEELKDSGLI